MDNAFDDGPEDDGSVQNDNDGQNQDDDVVTQ